MYSPPGAPKKPLLPFIMDYFDLNRDNNKRRSYKERIDEARKVQDLAKECAETLEAEYSTEEQYKEYMEYRAQGGARDLAGLIREIESPKRSKTNSSTAPPPPPQTTPPPPPPPPPPATSCPVCFDLYATSSRVVLIPCGHVVCNVCLLSLDGCPLCRKYIASSNSVYL